MNENKYILRKKAVNQKISDLVAAFGLALCYRDSQEEILKSNEVIMVLKKKYIFISILADNTKQISAQIDDVLRR